MAVVPQRLNFRFANLGFNSWAAAPADTHGTLKELRGSVTPKILKVYPNVGSTAGTLLWINVAGFGPNVGGLNVMVGTTVVCTDIISTAYDWISCNTVLGAVPNGDILIKDRTGTDYTALDSNGPARY